eukprot:NODE_16363_length_998_cov_5.694604.p2 GENE.NODE_16363_length_998_cov_5.694604~~NODE_16363_length_998_cov_5.694604.p2  ORF type:complete len:131 (+),score=10.80 NODE_16363_length_998_cov_5.694604:389-781(+)
MLSHHRKCLAASIDDVGKKKPRFIADKWLPFAFHSAWQAAKPEKVIHDYDSDIANRQAWHAALGQTATPCRRVCWYNAGKTNALALACARPQPTAAASAGQNNPVCGGGWHRSARAATVCATAESISIET